MSKRILVVDDDAKTVYLLRETLGSTGEDYEVIGVHSGEQALQQIDSNHFDLLITDLRMPGLDGFELLEQVKQRSPLTKLILITGYDTDDFAAETQRLQIAHSLTKPFRMEELIDMVQQTIGRTTINRIGMLSLSAEQFASLTQIVDSLRQAVGAQYVLLSDSLGQLIADSGQATGRDVTLFLSLIAGSFSTSAKLAERLTHKQSFQLNFYEGEARNIVTARAGQLVLGLIVLRAGEHNELIWRAAKNAVQQIQDVFTQQPDANRAGPAATSATLPQSTTESIDQLLAIEASRERRRLAREIHDGPTQILVNALFQLAFIEKLLEHDPAHAQQELQTLQVSFRSGLNEMRRFMFGLRLPSLDAMSLTEALAELCDDFQQRSRINTDFNVSGISTRLPVETESTILRIIQEALQNIQKHAGASRASVSLQQNSHNLIIEVRDNGHGFDSEQAGSQTSGLGLNIMRERVQSISGTFEIDTNAGVGTRIRLAVPS